MNHSESQPPTATSVIQERCSQLMNISDKFNILIPDMNSKQREFINLFRHEFQLIDQNLLSTKSNVEIQGSYLIITLLHASDINTWIEFRIEKREIYIIVVGFGYSMWQFAKSTEQEFNIVIQKFIIDALKCKFRKLRYFNKDGNLIKEELIWDDRADLNTTILAEGPFSLIKKWLRIKSRNEELRITEVNYSKFI